MRGFRKGGLERGMVSRQGFIYMEIRMRGFRKDGLERLVVSYQGYIYMEVGMRSFRKGGLEKTGGLSSGIHLPGNTNERFQKRWS